MNIEDMKNMSSEEIIKTKTEEMVTRLKNKMQKDGITLTSFDEMIFRMGLSYGMTLSTFVINGLSPDITMGEYK